MPHSPRPLADYHARLQRVSDHIHGHLDEPLNLAQLAELGCLSPCHWHRIYASFFGETMAATVKRLRLQKAAGDLAQTTLPVRQVATRCGYPNVQSFTRAFSQAYGLPPAQYRTRGPHVQFTQDGQFNYGLPGHHDGAFAVHMTDIDAFDVMGVPHRGSYMEIGKSFTALFGCLAARGINASGLRCVGVYLDDPFSVPEKALRSLACVASPVPGRLPPKEMGLQTTTVAGGRYAVLRYQGPYASMHAAYQWLFGHWLLQSGEQAADAPVFEDYLNSPLDTAPAGLLTDIYMPLLA
jgi:AraC family transcriptional regulator